MTKTVEACEQPLEFFSFRGRVDQAALAAFLEIDEDHLYISDQVKDLIEGEASIGAKVRAVIDDLEKSAANANEQHSKVIRPDRRPEASPHAAELAPRISALKTALNDYEAITAGNFEASALQNKQVAVPLSNGRFDWVEYPFYVLKIAQRTVEVPAGCLIPENGEEAAM